MRGPASLRALPRRVGALGAAAGARAAAPTGGAAAGCGPGASVAAGPWAWLTASARGHAPLANAASGRSLCGSARAAAAAADGETAGSAPPAASPAASPAPSSSHAPCAADAEGVVAKGLHPPPRRPRVLSGVQPTGTLHLGNWLGAVRTWTELQDSYDTLFTIVDLHAITVPHDPAVLTRDTYAAAATYLAAGIDPERSTVFVQSHVPSHAELAWLLQCITPLGWLLNAAQFKDKAAKAAAEAAADGSARRGGAPLGSLEEFLAGGAAEAARGAPRPPAAAALWPGVSAGLLTYPVLMAADILAYNAELVPTGDDQRQHIELARALARRANALFPPPKAHDGGKAAEGAQSEDAEGDGATAATAEAVADAAPAAAPSSSPSPVSPTSIGRSRLWTMPIVEPRPLLHRPGARCMSLTDGRSKMSKSAPSDASRINLTDPPEVIARKIKRAKTDAYDRLEFDNPDRPEATNLLTIYQAVTGKTREQVLADVEGLRWGGFKALLADAVVQALEPMQKDYARWMDDRAALDDVLERGAERAENIAVGHVQTLRARMGFLPRRKGRF